MFYNLTDVNEFSEILKNSTDTKTLKVTNIKSRTNGNTYKIVSYDNNLLSHDNISTIISASLRNHQRIFDWMQDQIIFSIEANSTFLSYLESIDLITFAFTALSTGLKLAAITISRAVIFPSNSFFKEAKFSFFLVSDVVFISLVIDSIKERSNN